MGGNGAGPEGAIRCRGGSNIRPARRRREPRPRTPRDCPSSAPRPRAPYRERVSSRVAQSAVCDLAERAGEVAQIVPVPSSGRWARSCCCGRRHRRRRPAARHQPVRPARRRERQEGRPRAARRAAGAGAGRSPTAHRGSWPAGLLDGVDTSPTRSPRCSAGSRPTATSPCRPTSTGARRRPARRPRGARRPHRTSRDVRLGAAVPALHRAVPQGRPADRRLPPGHRRSPSGTSPCPTGRSRSARADPAQAVGDGRCSPSRAAPCCACT